VNWLIWPRECHGLAALPPSYRHTTVAFFNTAEPRMALHRVVEAGRVMDSSQALLNERRQKDDIVPVLPWPQTAKARRDEPRVWSDSTTVSPEPIDVTAEETCPAPGPQAPAEGVLRKEPALAPTQAPSATTFELMNQLDALAQDLAVRSRASSEQHSE